MASIRTFLIWNNLHPMPLRSVNCEIVKMGEPSVWGWSLNIRECVRGSENTGGWRSGGTGDARRGGGWGGWDEMGGGGWKAC